MTRKRAKSADQTSLETPSMTETPPNTAQPALGLTVNPAVCYYLRRSRVHLGNVGFSTPSRPHAPGLGFPSLEGSPAGTKLISQENSDGKSE